MLLYAPILVLLYAPTLVLIIVYAPIVVHIAICTDFGAYTFICTDFGAYRSMHRYWLFLIILISKQFICKEFKRRMFQGTDQEY